MPDEADFGKSDGPAHVLAEASKSPQSAQDEAKTAETGSNGLKPRKRDASATRARILEASRTEFSEHGYSGARIDRIAKSAQSNVQMIYRYFGSKEALYLTVLEDTYARVRSLERKLELGGYEPLEGMKKLIEFTFDFLIEDPVFVAIIRNENVAGGRFVRMSDQVPASTLPLVEAIVDLMKRGRETGVFERDVDPTQLYITILSLCFTHLSNQHTLSVMFQRDLSDQTWLAERRAHVVDVVLTFLSCDRTRSDNC